MATTHALSAPSTKKSSDYTRSNNKRKCLYVLLFVRKQYLVVTNGGFNCPTDNSIMCIPTVGLVSCL